MKNAILIAVAAFLLLALGVAFYCTPRSGESTSLTPYLSLKPGTKVRINILATVVPSIQPLVGKDHVILPIEGILESISKDTISIKNENEFISMSFGAQTIRSIDIIDK